MSAEYLKEWVHKAEEDYTVATALARRRKRPTPNAVVFHCQQCAEKYLKAFLIHRNVAFPKTHDLLELHRLCSSEEPTFAQIGDLLDQMKKIYGEFDDGYTILSNRNGRGLLVSEYLMPHTRKRPKASRRMRPTDKTWKAILERANYRCEWNGMRVVRYVA